MKNNYYKWAVWLYKSGFVLLFVLSLLFAFNTTKIDFTAPLATDIWDNYGSIVGGLVGALFSLASILLLIHTIREQELEGHRQKIESRFFELLKIHLDNSTRIRLNDKEGRYAIARLLGEYRLCYKLAREINKERKSKYTEVQLLNFAYLAFYFGSYALTSSKEDKGSRSAPIRFSNQAITFRAHVKDYDKGFVETFVKRTTDDRDQIKQDEGFRHKLFVGHQIRLSQYFRHLFQTVTYINNQKHIDYKTKYEYIKTLRAQLSPHEQLLLFANSKSVLGYEWELNYPDDPNRQLITKYNLIKNIIWGGEVFDKHYPCVEYENKPVPPCRAALREKYM